MTAGNIIAFVPGVEDVLSTLMPQRPLAAMAGALHDQAHEAQILDFGVLSALRPFADSGYTQAASEWYSQRHHGAFSSLRYRQIHRLWQKAQEQRRAWILNALLQAAPAQAYVFLVRTRADLCETLAVAESLKSHYPNTPLFATGSYVEQCGDVMIARCGVFDALLLPDVETTLPALIEMLAQPDQWQKLPNLLLPREDGVFHTPRVCRTMDAVAKPCYTSETYPALNLSEKWMYFSLEPSRGIHHLTHSDAAALWCSHHLRLRKAEQTAAEAEAIVREHYAHAFHIEGSATPGEHLRKTAIALQQKGHPYRFSLSASFAQLQPAQIPALEACGGLSIGFRLHSGSQRLLQDYYGENFSITPMESLLRATQSSGLLRALQLTYPCQEEDRHTMAETLRILLRNQPEATSLRLALPGPGARWTQYPKQFGFQIHHERFNRWLAGQREYFPLDTTEAFSGVRMRHKRSGTIRMEQEALIREMTRQDLFPHGDERQLLVSRMLTGEQGWREEAVALDHALRTLDVAAIASFMERFNDKSVVPEKTLLFRRFLPVAAAVGN